MKTFCIDSKSRQRDNSAKMKRISMFLASALAGALLIIAALQVPQANAALRRLAQFTGGVQFGTSGTKFTTMRIGTFGPLVAGTQTVAATWVTANTKIFLCGTNTGGTAGGLRTPSRVAGTSFTVTSSSASDTGSGIYIAFEP